ncbi:MAG: hypothetical protein ACRDRK_10025 [Pseudonocardia sp.]
MPGRPPGRADVTSRKERRYAFDTDVQDDLDPGHAAPGPDAGI